MTKQKKFSFDGILKSPLALWLISISLSVAMWVYVTGTEESSYITRKFSVPLEYRSLEAQSILRGRLSEVDIEIRGTEDAITRLDYDSVRAYVDARNLIPGKRYTVNINVEYPDTVTFLSCFPSQTTLDIVRQVTRLMTVETILPQNIPEGQYIEDVEIIPKEVGIRGAEDDLAKIGSVRITPTLDELQRGTDILMPVKFDQSEPFDGTVVIEPAQVRFRGKLVRGLPRKRVPVNARLAGRVDDDYEVKSVVVDPSEIQIEGSSDALAKVAAIDTEIIEVSMMASNTTVIVPLRQPDIEGISALSVPSARVSIQVSEARAEKMIMNVPVEFRGTDRPQNWASNPPSVSVSVEGRPSMVAEFDAQDCGLHVFADLSNIFMTPVMLPVTAEMTSGDLFRITRIEPPNVTVNSAETM